MSADPDTGEIGRLLADPDGLTDEERWGRLPSKLQAELEELQRRLNEKMERASKGTYYRGGDGLVGLLGAVAAEDPGPARVGPAVRGVLEDLASGEPIDALAAAALTPDGGLTRDRLARRVMALARELWAELDRRTGEALEAQGVPWAPVVGRFLAGERGQRESDREREREAGWPVAEVEIEPAPWLSYEQAAANDREDRGTVAALGELRVPDPERPDAPELLAWDAWLAEWLRAGGASTLAGEVLGAARRRAAEVAEGTKPPGDLWSLWAPRWGDPTPYGSLPVLATLAELAWPRLRAELEREPEAAAPLVWQSNEDFLLRKHPSLLLAAGGPLVRSLVRARPVDGGLLVDADNRQIPLALRSTVEGLIVGDLAALGTAAAQRLVRMVVEAGAVAAYGAGRPVLYSTAPRVEVYKDRVTGDAVLSCWGGWPALARLCGLEGHKGRDQVKDAAYALAAVSLRWKGPKKGGGADALLGVRDGDTTGHEDYRAAPGREARVVLRISPPLAPGLTHDMPKGRRALAPVLRDPPALPRALDRHAAAIGRADFLAMFEARALALDLYNEDRIALPWDRVFEEAAVPRQARGPALEALQGSPEAPRWVRLTATYWTLAEAGPPGDALAWLKEAGRQEASGSRAGKAGAATRQGRAKRRKP